MTKRNNNIDFLRGIATLCIILIHTSFWSGELYLPVWFKNLALIIDVPVFMFISGMSFTFVNSVSKNIISLIKQWKKWIFFVFIYAVIIIVFYREQFSFKDFFCWLVYYFPNPTSLIVVKGSIWFWIMYIKVTLLGSVVICANNAFVKNKEKNGRILFYSLLLFLLMFIYTSFSGQNEFIFDAKTLFFTIIYLLGYISMNYRINLKRTVLYEFFLVAITCILFYIFRYNVGDIQTIKFSFSIVYLPFSMISIILFWYLKDRLKIKDKNPINYIGKNAIWFYFAQGISSSLIYYAYDYLKNYHYLIIFLIMLILNIIMSLIIAILLEKAYNLFVKFDFEEKLKKIILKKK